MKTKRLLLFITLLFSSYNLDASDAEHRQSSQCSSCYGYSISLYSHNSSTGFSSWIFVSAPKFKIGSPIGKLYTAHTEPRIKSLMIKYTRVPTSNNPSINIITGTSMDVSEIDGSFVVCNPLQNKTFYINGKNETSTLAGVCYVGSVVSPEAETRNLETYIQHNNPTTGFAVQYPRLQNFTPLAPVPESAYATDPIMGSPLHENVGAVHKINHRNWTILEEYTGHYLPLFGYAITSGIYFDKSQLMVAGGAPGWNFVGQVAIMKYYPDALTPFPIISKINGTELGEFFGATLTSGDLNNDGLDDLIVGAPHWKNDNGRVYIYLGNEEGFSEPVLVLEGSADDGLFGYSLSSGDFDNDGFDDLVVAAPWENAGIVYIYDGSANLAEVRSLELIQTLTFPNLKRFGFSLSKFVDVDGDGLQDFTVGAYGAANVMLITSDATDRTIITLTAIPPILLRNSTSFVLKFCVDHEPNLQIDGVMCLLMDKDYNRVTEITSKYITSEFRNCNEKTFYLQNIGNYLEDIEINAKWELPKSNSQCTNIERSTGQLCENNDGCINKRLSFDIGCGVDRICQASIYAELEIQDISNSTYIIGSNDLSLVLMIRNDGEPAYSTSVIFYIPEAFFFKHLMHSCHEERSQQTMMVKCDVGDPLTKDTPKNITLDLTISSNTSLYEPELNFTVDIKTGSTNVGQSKVAITLKVKANVSIALSGKAHQNIRYFSLNNKPSTLAFAHNYQVSTFGVTPISTAYLKLLIPCKLGCLEFLTITQNPRIFLSDRFYECTNSRTTPILPSDANANQLQCENIREQHYTRLNTQKSEAIYLNCSMPNVMCEQVECEISFPEPAHDFGRLPVQLNMEISELIGHTKDKKIAIHFTTEASVHVLNKKIQFDVPGTGIPFPVTTIFYFLPHSLYGYNIFNTVFKDVKVLKEELGIQTILGSVFVGLLILGLLVIVLRHVGFFERKLKEAMKSEEMEKPNDATNDAQGPD